MKLISKHRGNVSLRCINIDSGVEWRGKLRQPTVIEMERLHPSQVRGQGAEDVKLV